MSPKSAFAVPNERIQEHAERVLSGPVTRRELALGFFESSASSAEVLVEGRSFYPRMLEDIASATSSIHINQFGFRPGIVGDAFADALIEKAAKGIAVRLVVDRQGSDPERGSRVLYDRLAAADVEVCVMRPTQARARVGPLGRGGATRWNLTALGHVDHRKVAVIDGRIGWVGGAGIEDHFQDGRFLDLFVRVAGPVVAQLQLVFLVSFHWLGGEIPLAELDSLFPRLEDGDDPVAARVLHNAPGRFRPITDAISPVAAVERMVGFVEESGHAHGVELKALHPESEELAALSDETRVVVSEPLGDLLGAWNEVPESHVGIVQPGADELRPFTPVRP